MIDPQNGMDGFTAWSVIDHHGIPRAQRVAKRCPSRGARRIRSSRTAERSETAEGRDRDDIPPNRDYAIDIISYESFREFDLVGRMGVAMLSNLFRVDIFGRLAVSFGVRW